MLRVALMLLALNTQVFALDKVLYGEDNRRDWFELSMQEKLLTRKVAAMIPKSFLSELNDGTYTYTAKLPTLLGKKKLCRDVPYYDQTSLSDCSGFLVAPDLLITAGHCVSEIENSCANYSWVFSYNLYGPNRLNYNMPRHDVYHCKEVVKAKTQTRLDYALIRLDRPAEQRSPMKLNRTVKIQPGMEVATIGHPLGLPTKYADDGVVLKRSSDYLFSVNLDTFAGNSGSPVFDPKTGDVFGILVRGKIDFAEDYDRSIGVCYTLNRCNEQARNCSEPDRLLGEQVVNIKKVLEEISLE